MFKKATITAVLLGVCLSGSALAQGTSNNMSNMSNPNPNSMGPKSLPAQVTATNKGETLVNVKGMTLYTYDKDGNGKSSCNGACAQNWHPFLATTSASPSGNWSVITRNDGTKQWAYKDKPLYTWSKDTKPGDTTGDGFKAVWHVAQP